MCREIVYIPQLRLQSGSLQAYVRTPVRPYSDGLAVRTDVVLVSPVRRHRDQIQIIYSHPRMLSSTPYRYRRAISPRYLNTTKKRSP